MDIDRVWKLSDLYHLDFELQDIQAERQKWTSGAVFCMDHPRKRNGIIYLNGATGQYTNRYAQVIDAPLKSLIFLPAGSRYSVLNIDCNRDLFDDAYLVEFNMTSNGHVMTLSDTPFVISDVNSMIISRLVIDAVKSYESASASPITVKAAVYALVAFLVKEAYERSNSEFQAILPGVELLKKNVFDDMSIQNIADNCNVSSGTFRRSFKDYTGKSPKQYCIDAKMDEAKSMLRETNLSISSIAETLHFDSSAYFCRLFKKKTGLAPGAYRKTHRAAASTQTE